MGIRNYLKKLGKRASGSWGRINHSKQMKAESKATRKQGKNEIRQLKAQDAYLKEVRWHQIDDLLDLEDPEDYH